MSPVSSSSPSTNTTSLSLALHKKQKRNERYQRVVHHVTAGSFPRWNSMLEFRDIVSEVRALLRKDRKSDSDVGSSHIKLRRWEVRLETRGRNFRAGTLAQPPLVVCRPRIRGPASGERKHRSFVEIRCWSKTCHPAPGGGLTEASR